MKRLRWLCLGLALALLCVPHARAAGTAEDLYAQAIEDASTIEPEELLPLKTTLTKDDPYAQWNEGGDRVLVCTWNNTPEDYQDGAAVTVGADPVWVFSGAELEAWYAANSGGVEDWELRLCQLIGLPPDAGYTHFTTLWADPEDLLRPAFDPDVTTNTMAEDLTGEDWYLSWFADNTAASYGEGGYPWTRLGYTYDWADNGTEYGLTEFILPTGAQATVEHTVTTQAYLDALATAEPDGAAGDGLDALNGKQLEITDMDTGALVPGVQAGKFDMAGACLTVTEERKQSVLFSEADYTGGIVAIVRDHEEDCGSQGLWSYLQNGFYKTFLLESRWKLFAGWHLLPVKLSNNLCLAAEELVVNQLLPQMEGRST